MMAICRSQGLFAGEVYYYYVLICKTVLYNREKAQLFHPPNACKILYIVERNQSPTGTLFGGF